VPTEAHAQFIVGGTNLTDHMTLEVMQPRVRVDIGQLPKQRFG
jgi:CO/xanthine dehydrogenase FAD-binding subunit